MVQITVFFFFLPVALFLYNSQFPKLLLPYLKVIKGQDGAGKIQFSVSTKNIKL